MDNNDILRRMRYILDLGDSKMIELFALGQLKVDRTSVSDWLKKEDEESFEVLPDYKLAVFLNGLIIDFRGKSEDHKPLVENRLNNNIILKKLKVAFNMTTDDVLDMFQLAGKQVSAGELGAFLRNPKHPKFRPCNDQYLRNFLTGLQVKFRGKN